MYRKEIPFGTFWTLHGLFVAIPIVLAWKFLWPFLGLHGPGYFYHTGPDCAEDKFFVASGIIVLVGIFGSLIYELWTGYKPVSDGSWREIPGRIACEFSFSMNPLAIPFLVSLGCFIAGIVMTYGSGRPTWDSLLMGSTGLFGLVICSWLDNRKKKKIKGSAPFVVSLFFLILGIVMLALSERSWSPVPVLVGAMGFAGLLICSWDFWLDSRKKDVRNKTPSS